MTLLDEEKEVLREVLRAAYLALKEEVYHTDNSDYKAELKKRERVFLSLMEKLEVKLS
ncbi:MAG: hypothetical protein ABI559_02795 [Chloroflexota bacterium]